MEDSALLNIIKAEEIEIDTAQLDEDRTRALDYFYGNAVGKLAPPDVPNRSSYVSRDVSDTIDWIMPSLIKTFLSADKVCEFSPKTPADVEAAKQETDIVNYIALEKNNAYEVFSSWFDDALLQKNGYVWAYWKTTKDIQEEQYRNLTQEEFNLIAQDQDVEIAEYEEISVVDELTGLARVVYNVTVHRVNTDGYVCYESVPPEMVRVGNDVTSTSVQDAKFIGIDVYMTISELRELGYEVDDDISDSYTGADSPSRNHVSFGDMLRQRYSRNVFNDYSNADPSSRTVCVRYRWMRVDYDDDGIAELRHIVLVGDTILLNEKADIIPISVITPRIISHDHYGRSIAEIVEDLQELKTTLFRSVIDNFVLANNTRYAIDENVVNLDDLLRSSPGGPVRVNGSPISAIVPMQHSMIGSPAILAVDMIDAIKEIRTGVTKNSMGTDSSNLNKTATAVSIMTNAANQRIEWIARTFAETGIANLFRIIHAMTRKYANREMIVRLRDKWVTVDPRSWAKRMDMVVTVGLGAANREVHLKNITMLGMIQERAFAAGVVSPENVFNMAVEAANAMGFKDAERFFTHPSKIPPKDPSANPEVMKIRAKLEDNERERQLKWAEMQRKVENDQFDKQLQTIKLINDLA